MYYSTRWLPFCAVAIFTAITAQATTLPRLSFEQIADQSEMVVSGQITRTWSAWDSEQKFIWTHYELSVSAAAKGSPGSIVEFAEPGGTVNGRSMTIAGAPGYSIGENVAIFLQRMPNNYLRTAGWGQGKFNLDANGKLHAGLSVGAVELTDQSRAGALVRPINTLNNMSFSQLRALVVARTSAVKEAK